jgi:hypothetical protein
MYRPINSAERVHLEIHKITIIGGAPPRLMPTASQPVWYHPYHLALGHLRVHQNTKTVRRSTRPPRSLCYLRRVWAPMPIPPYTITFQPSSSGTALVSRVIISRPSGASGVHEGSYNSGSQDIPVLRETGQDIFSRG